MRCIINVSSVCFADFRSARFTTLGAKGNIGPTTLGNHYIHQDHEHLVILDKGIQCFTVPRTSNYRITTAGMSERQIKKRCVISSL